MNTVFEALEAEIKELDALRDKLYCDLQVARDVAKETNQIVINLKDAFEKTANKHEKLRGILAIYRTLV